MISSRRTKIVCTIGPSVGSKEGLRKLIEAGMNVARVNFSHGSHEDHKQTMDWIKELRVEMNRSIAILMDLQGPKIRAGKMKDGGQQVNKGDIITLIPYNGEEGTSEIVPIDFPGLAEDAEVGNRILIDDGLLELKIVAKEGKDLKAIVVVGGMLKSRKGINLPDVDVSQPSLTEKDLEDLEFGLIEGVEYIAMSFVRKAQDIQEIISKVRLKNSHAQIIAKIEKPEAIEAIDDIIEETDGIMIARGDLGIEIEAEKVPIIQKSIIDKCRMLGKPVITATQMLDSMIYNPRPTRAEASDVANAVLDGSDAIMLSGETAAGKYPYESVQMMDKICRSVEASSEDLFYSLNYRKPDWKEKQVVESVSYSAVKMADYVDATAISAISHSGSTARRIAKFRPKVPIVVFTESEMVRHQLSLVWGVTSIGVEQLFGTDESILLMEEYLRKEKVCNEGERVIFCSSLPVSERGTTNTIMVNTISKAN